MRQARTGWWPLPAIADRVRAVRVPAGTTGRVLLAVAVVAVPEQVAILRDGVEHGAKPAGVVRSTGEVPEVLPPTTNLVTRIRMPAGGSRAGPPPRFPRRNTRA